MSDPINSQQETHKISARKIYVRLYTAVTVLRPHFKFTAINLLSKRSFGFTQLGTIFIDTSAPLIAHSASKRKTVNLAFIRAPYKMLVQ
jgi:hypothetical protein